MLRAPSAAPVRIVADTNTVASGLIWQGPPRQIIDAARQGTITLHTSLTLLAELAEIVGRGKFVRPILRAGLSAAALGAEAQLIVSGDRDLLVLGTFQAIPILPAAQVLEHIAARTSRFIP